MEVEQAMASNLCDVQSYLWEKSLEKQKNTEVKKNNHQSSLSSNKTKTTKIVMTDVDYKC